MRDRYGRHTFGQGCLMARRLIEAGTRFVQMNWPAVANGDPTSTPGIRTRPISDRSENLHCPKLDSGLSSLLEDMDERGLLKETLVIAIGEFGRSPRLGREHIGQQQLAGWPGPLALLLYGLVAGAGIRRGALYGKSDATGSSPAENPVHPTQMLATVYHALGIDPNDRSTTTSTSLGNWCKPSPSWDSSDRS